MVTGHSVLNTQNDAIHYTLAICLNDVKSAAHRLALSMLTFRLDSTPIMHAVSASTCKTKRDTLIYCQCNTYQLSTGINFRLKLGVLRGYDNPFPFNGSW